MYSIHIYIHTYIHIYIYIYIYTYIYTYWEPMVFIEFNPGDTQGSLNNGEPGYGHVPSMSKRLLNWDCHKLPMFGPMHRKQTPGYD